MQISTNTPQQGCKAKFLVLQIKAVYSIRWRDIMQFIQLSLRLANLLRKN